MTAVTIPACPSWCTLPPDHEVDFGSGEGLNRGHSAAGPESLRPAASSSNFYAVEMGIGSSEDINAAGQVVDSRGPLIDLNSPACELTADEAETVANNLLTLAGRLREIQAES
jgi:hypothetical protein